MVKRMVKRKWEVNHGGDPYLYEEQWQDCTGEHYRYADCEAFGYNLYHRPIADIPIKPLTEEDAFVLEGAVTTTFEEFFETATQEQVNEIFKPMKEEASE